MHMKVEEPNECTRTSLLELIAQVFSMVYKEELNVSRCTSHSTMCVYDVVAYSLLPLPSFSPFLLQRPTAGCQPPDTFSVHHCLCVCIYCHRTMIWTSIKND